MTTKRLITLFAGAAVAAMVFAPSALAGFGIKDFKVSVEDRNGTTQSQAGSHPYALTLHFDLNTDASGSAEGGEMRDFYFELPSGLIGDPEAVPSCPRQEFEGPVPDCAPSTQIGFVRTTVTNIGELSGPLYNIVPPSGVPALFGFSNSGLVALGSALLESEEGYAVHFAVPNVPLGVTSITATVWGTPADPSHDPLRGPSGEAGLPSDAPLQPYLTLPATCGAPLQVRASTDSKLNPGVYSTVTAPLLEQSGEAVSFSGCERVPFSPRVLAAPNSARASNPSGLGFQLRLPDLGLLNPRDGAVAETEPRKVVVALPVGITANPSFAEGIGTCSEAKYAAEKLQRDNETGCPESSKLGDVVAQTPLLKEPVEGAVYLATPYQNQFGSLIALYLVARAPERGILIKQAGSAQLDPQTGQITTTFENLPPIPYSSFKLNFREGARAPLVTPPACGEYPTVAKLTPVTAASDSEAVEQVSSFKIEHGVDGAACPPAGVPPFHPSLIAGTLNNQAGAYSSVNVQAARSDGEQEITGFSTLLPPGVSANLNGVPFCSETQIALARGKTGAQEQTEPSCPQASEIGHSLVGAGVGTTLAYTPGKLYMAGPFEGAPFSVVSITAAKVGPFDLGTVVVHLPLNIDPITARVSIPAGAADQIPHIIKGIVVHVRDIRVSVDRPNFALNPTNCNPLTYSASVIGSGQDTANPTDDTPYPISGPFQTANCANLGFKPSFKVSASGKTSRQNGAALKVSLTYPKAPLGTQANIRSVKVSLPKQLPSRLTTLQKACTASQFEANPAGCPAASRVGTATAVTPILPVPLTGPAYFVSHGGAKFPELILVLQGYGVTIDLHGETFISKTGITSSTFHTVPDQPVTNFQLTLPQGPNSALAANGNLCATKLTMPTLFTAQNGATIKQSTPVGVSGCPKHKTKVKHKKKK